MEGIISLLKKFPNPLLAVALALSLILNIYFLTQSNPQDRGVRVIGVIDGDTLVFEGKSRLRLRYVDAPDDPHCGSQDAKQVLTQLTVGKYVRIEEQLPDQYGRGMALIYDGKTLINRELIASGWVRYHHDTTSVTESIKQVAQEARDKKLGIYGSCHSTVNIKNPDCIIKGNIDKSTDTHIYYTQDCAQYAFAIVEEDIGEQWFCTESQAQKAGYTKASTCKITRAKH